MRIAVADYYDVPADRPLSLIDRLPYVIIPACIVFNLILCYINTHIFTVSIPLIASVELMLTGLSTVYGFMRIDRTKLYWLVILILQVSLLACLSLAREEALLKPIRDMVMVPIYITLGLAAVRTNPTKMIFWLSGVIGFFAVYEAFFLESFTGQFNIFRYYVDKGVLPEDFISPLDLAASGQRPNARFLFDFLDIHRISSVFLEPVSLGFYAFITGLYFIAIKDHVSRKTYLAGIVISFIFIWMSDARMAMGSLTLMLLVRPVLAKMDHRFSVLVWPTILVAGMLIYVSQIFGTTGEGIGWRVNDSMEKLSLGDWNLVLGVSKYNFHAEDSGLLKILQHNGLLGFMLYWLSPIFFMRRLSPEGTIYLFGLTMFLSFGFMISAAILTIKSAALLWFLYGYIVAKYTIEPDRKQAAVEL